MKKIKLTRGKYALVDDADFEWLNQWKWSYAKVGYAFRMVPGGKYRTALYLHTLVNETPKGLVTDHINQNKLDNRQSNLRTTTRGKNQWNRGLPKNNKSGHLGICWSKANQKWMARIKVGYKGIYLGYFDNLHDAVKVRKQAELKYFTI